ncbi:unnamed protein product [Lymnaea stagnalis]|uniref:Eukaryotic translation initiation factor 2-alpha kinase 1 n=1 Tax=Lymnaea stagnalis TaxID=6523 RepID=A0AAV2IN50_LYMST
MAQPFKAQSDSQLVTEARHQDESPNKSSKITTKKFTDIKLREGVKPIRQMDSSDLSKQNSNQAIKKMIELKQQESKALALASGSSLPPHLLMASLLEQLCYMYVKERTKANQLFKILCERLSRLNVIAPLSHLDEMSSLRFQHRAMLDKIVRTAMKSLDKQSLLALPPLDQSLNIDRLSIRDDDIISEHTSRYKIEFQEVSLLGKGGFGYVFKAKNYLDGCEYAVKKIKFKHKNTGMLLKLLREVKALANLHHTNIVGYNAAWLEYDNPLCSRKENFSNESPLAQDSSNEATESKVYDRQERSTSLSIQFCLSDDEENKPVPSPNLGGNGLAMNAKYFSQVKVEEVFGRSENVLLNGGRGDAGKFTDSSPKLANSRGLTHGSPRPKKERHKHVVIEEEISSSFSFNYSDNNCESQGQEKVVVKCGQHFEIDLDISNDHSFDCLAMNTEAYNDKINQVSPHHHGHSSEISVNKMTRVAGSLKNNSPVKETGGDSVVDSKKWSPLREPQEAIHHSTAKSSPSKSSSAKPSPSRSQFKHSKFFHSPPFSDDIDNDPDEACHDDKLSFYSESQAPPSSPPSSSVIFSNVSLVVEEEMSYSGNSGLPPNRRTTRQSRSMEHPAPRVSRVSEKDGVYSVDIDTPALPSRKGPQEDELPAYKRSISSGAANNMDEVMESRNHNYDFQNSITLYIQMELCSTTLQEWLYDRNSQQGDSYDATLFCSDNMRIFHQLLLGVNFIHSHGLIHRDLKPRNIFLSGNDLHVKIGDFGLAKEDMLSQGREEIVLKPSPTDEGTFLYDNHTTGVGTLSYASPEQLKGSFYDVKVIFFFFSFFFFQSDMYSLGVIFFEMFNVFHTDMERLRELEKLRKVNIFFFFFWFFFFFLLFFFFFLFFFFQSDMYSLGVILFEMFNVFHTDMERLRELEKLRKVNHCPEAFTQKWPLQADSIKALVSSVPSERPSAQDLLNSQLFLSQEQVR